MWPDSVFFSFPLDFPLGSLVHNFYTYCCSSVARVRSRQVYCTEPPSIGHLREHANHRHFSRTNQFHFETFFFTRISFTVAFEWGARDDPRGPSDYFPFLFPVHESGIWKRLSPRRVKFAIVQRRRADDGIRDQKTDKRKWRWGMRFDKDMLNEDRRGRNVVMCSLCVTLNSHTQT